MKKFRANMTEEDQEAYKEKDRLMQMTFKYQIESFDEKDQREFCRQAMEKSRDNQLEEIKENDSGKTN